MIKGLAAGPYGNPYRDAGIYDLSSDVVEGIVSQGAWSLVDLQLRNQLGEASLYVDIGKSYPFRDRIDIYEP